MIKIKELLNKLFPNHDTGTATFMVAILLSVVMMSIIFVNDWCTQDVTIGEVSYDIGAVCVFLGAAGATYVFGKNKPE